MKALFPPFSRVAGYVIMAVGLFMPFLLMLGGRVNDGNLLLFKECAKLLMMIGALMIIFASTANETPEKEQIRNRATRNAIFLTLLFLFFGMMHRVAKGDLVNVDSSSFLIFLVWNVICLEFGLKKSAIDALFHRGKKKE